MVRSWLLKGVGLDSLRTWSFRALLNSFFAMSYLTSISSSPGNSYHGGSSFNVSGDHTVVSDRYELFDDEDMEAE